MAKLKPTTESIIHDLKVLDEFKNNSCRDYICRIAADRLEELENELKKLNPVVRAHWIFEWDSERDPKRLFVRVVCSNCGLKTGQKSNYCPQCGSVMDKEENDNA